MTTTTSTSTVFSNQPPPPLVDDDDEGSDGSDSDCTTTSSTEHLSREEKMFLRHTARQEPQGQEEMNACSRSWQQQQQQLLRSPGCRSCSVNRLDGSGVVGPVESQASSCRTLIIHGSLSDESWARIAGTGSIPDLAAGNGGGGPSSHYLTSTPNSKSTPFHPTSDDGDCELLLLGSAERRRRRGHQTPPGPSSAAGFTTRSLPRSAKDFSTLYRHPSHLASLASLYQEEEREAAAVAAAAAAAAELDECCERRKQLKMLQGLAREMNWSLPLGASSTQHVTGTGSMNGIGPSNTTTDSYPLSVVSVGDEGLLSMSDTLLLNDQLSQSVHGTSQQQQHLSHRRDSSNCSSSSYARDFTYLSKPPPAYPRTNRTPMASAIQQHPIVDTSLNSRNPSTTSSTSSSSRRIKIRRALSRSHPDLSKMGKEIGSTSGGGGGVGSGNTGSSSNNNNNHSNNTTIWRALRHKVDGPSATSGGADDEGKETSDSSSSVTVHNGNGNSCSAAQMNQEVAIASSPSDDKAAVWSTPELVDAILEENFALRQQVQTHKDNIAKLQKFEEELSSVHAAHQALVRSSERKESLERSARFRLETEWRRVQELNAALRSQVEVLSSQLALRNSAVALSGSSSAAADSDWQNQIARRDALIGQLVSQNKELMMNKERQDIELCAQKATLQQQRSHIEILESALSRAQLHVNRLEDEYRRQCNESASSAKMVCSGEVNGSAHGSSEREMANMEIRIRDLESKLSEKEMLIHLLQRASMDRELAFSTTRLPESVSLLNRHHPVTSHEHQSQHPAAASSTNLVVANNKAVRSCSSTSGVSSIGPSSSRGSAASVASNSPSRNRVIANSAAPPPASATFVSNEAAASVPPNSDTAQSLDNQLRALDRFYQNKQSLIQALQSDKERFPNNYWPS